MHYGFQALTASRYLERLQRCQPKELGLSLQTLWLGIAATVSIRGEIIVAFSLSDGTYNIDFAVHTLDAKGNEVSPCNNPDISPGNGDAERIASSAGSTPVVNEDTARNLLVYLVNEIRQYSQSHYYTFAGAGITRSLAQMCPGLPATLWLDLDIVPLVFEHSLDWPAPQESVIWNSILTKRLI